MPRLPPVEKLPLAVRKNVRDEWDNNKADFEKQISDVLGTPWTIDINPLQIAAYAGDSYAKDSLGSCLKNYLEGVVSQLKYFEDRQGEEGVKELNHIASAHVFTMDVDDRPEPVSYCGSRIIDGKLAIVFNAKNLGTNAYDALASDGLLKALNDAPASFQDGLSFAARLSIRDDWTPKVGELKEKICKLLGKADAVKLEPNFVEAFAKLKAESQVKKTGLDENWERQLGGYIYNYFESVSSNMDYQKFEDDDLLQEGFLEAVGKGVIAFRIVEKLKYDSYCEVVVEDGTLFIQTTTKTWGSNAYYAAQQLVDQL